MRALLPAVLLLAATCAPAAGLNKCADGGGRITYTSDSCEKEGLQPAGPIRDRVTILPTANAATPRHQPPRKDEAPRREPAVKTVSPLIDTLAK